MCVTRVSFDISIFRCMKQERSRTDSLSHARIAIVANLKNKKYFLTKE